MVLLIEDASLGNKPHAQRAGLRERRNIDEALVEGTRIHRRRDVPLDDIQLHLVRLFAGHPRALPVLHLQVERLLSRQPNLELHLISLALVVHIVQRQHAKRRRISELLDGDILVDIHRTGLRVVQQCHIRVVIPGHEVIRVLRTRRRIRPAVTAGQPRVCEHRIAEDKRICNTDIVLRRNDFRIDPADRPPGIRLHRAVFRDRQRLCRPASVVSRNGSTAHHDIAFPV